MSDDLDFDFGFTAVDESELEVAQKATQAASTTEATQAKLDKLYNAVTPLLNNLKKNPSKDYIYWPNRLDKIEEFSDALDKVYKG